MVLCFVLLANGMFFTVSRGLKGCHEEIFFTLPSRRPVNPQLSWKTALFPVDGNKVHCHLVSFVLA